MMTQFMAGNGLAFAISQATGSSSTADIGKPTQSCDHCLAYERCIYIHGTPVEGKLGSPLDHRRALA